MIREAAKLILASERPVLYVGGGILKARAAEALLELAELTQIHVVTTLMARGSFPDSHSLCLGMPGMHGNATAVTALQKADLLVTLGARFDDRVTGKVSEFAKHGKIVHIDIDPSEINKIKAATVPVVGNVGDALRELVAMIDQDPNVVPRPSQFSDWIQKIDGWREQEPFKYTDRDDAIVPQYAIERLWQIVKRRNLLEDTIVTTGVGQHQMWAAQYWKFMSPRTWFTSGGLGSMGFGLPAAIGAQVAHPLRTVIDIDGDGSFLMNIQELATAHCEKLPVKVLLLNNQHLGMVVQWEDRFYESNRAHTYLGAGFDHDPYPDFAAIAKGFGCAARSVVKKLEFDDALEEMLDTPKPFVLDVLVPYQEHVLPMIPGGMTVRDIIKA
jgi:acetolactate synthase-1/2/3 large subunit